MHPPWKLFKALIGLLAPAPKDRVILETLRAGDTAAIVEARKSDKAQNQQASYAGVVPPLSAGALKSVAEKRMQLCTLALNCACLPSLTVTQAHHMFIENKALQYLCKGPYGLLRCTPVVEQSTPNYCDHNFDDPWVGSNDGECNNENGNKQRRTVARALRRLLCLAGIHDPIDAVPAEVVPNPGSVCHDFSRFLESPLSADVVFVVEGQRFHAHRVILAASVRTDVFAALFERSGASMLEASPTHPRLARAPPPPPAVSHRLSCGAGEIPSTELPEIELPEMKAEVFRYVLREVYGASDDNEGVEGGEAREQSAGGTVPSRLLPWAGRWPRRR